MRITKSFDLRPIDIDSGKRLALPAVEQIRCDCCGKRISRGSVTSTGHRIGSECASSIDLLGRQRFGAEFGKDHEFFRITRKQFEFFAAAR